jgi:hypothetical protein
MEEAPMSTTKKQGQDPIPAALAGLLAMCGGLDTPTVRRAREALES